MMIIRNGSKRVWESWKGRRVRITRGWVLNGAIICGGYWVSKGKEEARPLDTTVQRIRQETVRDKRTDKKMDRQIDDR